MRILAGVFPENAFYDIFRPLLDLFEYLAYILPKHAHT